MVSGSIKFLEFLKYFVDDFGRSRFVVVAFIDEQFLELRFDVFNYILGVVRGNNFVFFAIEEDDGYV